ncbi:BrnT family toxin [Thiomicrospira microaerophila]
MDSRLVVLAWTPRGKAKRIISMRKANEREQQRFKQYL